MCGSTIFERGAPAGAAAASGAPAPEPADPRHSLRPPGMPKTHPPCTPPREAQHQQDPPRGWSPQRGGRPAAGTAKAPAPGHEPCAADFAFAAGGPCLEDAEGVAGSSSSLGEPNTPSRHPTVRSLQPPG